MGDLYALGPKGETHALHLLQKQGYRILEKNYTCRNGEIDLIAWQRDTLVFVEVRAREVSAHSHPLESITPAKQRKVCRAATYYVQRQWKKRLPNIRFDVVWIEAAMGEIVASGLIPGAFSMQ